MFQLYAYLVGRSGFISNAVFLFCFSSVTQIKQFCFTVHLGERQLEDVGVCVATIQGLQRRLFTGLTVTISATILPF